MEIGCIRAERSAGHGPELQHSNTEADYLNFDFIEMMESRRILEFASVPFDERKINTVQSALLPGQATSIDYSGVQESEAKAACKQANVLEQRLIDSSSPQLKPTALCCWRGQSRSWFLVGVYLMVYKGVSFIDFMNIRTEVLLQLEHYYEFYNRCKRDNKRLIGYKMTGRKKHRSK